MDLLVRREHLLAVASLAELFPELRIVINHCAGVPIDGREPLPTWIGGILSAAQYPNVYCKVSGLASATRQTPAPDDVEFYAPTLDLLWEAFGEDRLIYGSDWPVCSRFAEYSSVLRVVREYFEAKGEDAAEKYFWKNSSARLNRRNSSSLSEFRTHLVFLR